MDCRVFAQQVQALVDDDMHAVERLLMEDHAGHCYACSELRRDTARLFRALDTLDMEPVPDGFADAVLQRIAAACPRRAHAASPRAAVRGATAEEPGGESTGGTVALAQQATAASETCRAAARSELLTMAALSVGLTVLGMVWHGLAGDLTRAGLGQLASAWYGWTQDVQAGFAWLRDASLYEWLAVGSALRSATVQAFEAFGGQLVMLAALMVTMAHQGSRVLRAHQRSWFVPFATCVLALGSSLALFSTLHAAPATREIESPRDEIVELEELVEARQASLDSLLQHIEALPQARMEKSILEEVHALTEALRADRRRLLQLRHAVVPEMERPPRPPRPPPPPRTARPEGDKIIARSLVRFGEDVEVRTGETINGDAIIIDGNLWVDGHVEGDAIVLGGDLQLGRRASVAGQAIAIAGRVNKTPGADVRGQEMSLTLMPGNFLGGTWPHWVSLVLDLFKLGLLLLVAGLFLAVVPDRIARARAQLGESFLKCFGVGLVVLFGGSFAVGVAVVLLSITFIGIPAALLVTLATGVLLIASLFVGVLLVGDRLQEALNFRRRAPWLSVGLGLLLIMLPELLSDVFRLAFPLGTGVAVSLFSKALVLVTVAAGLGALVLSRLGGGESGRSPHPSM